MTLNLKRYNWQDGQAWKTIIDSTKVQSGQKIEEQERERDSDNDCGDSKTIWGK